MSSTILFNEETRKHYSEGNYIAYRGDEDPLHSPEKVDKVIFDRLSKALERATDDLPKTMRQVSAIPRDGGVITAVPAYDAKLRRYLHDYWDVTVPVETSLGGVEAVVEGVHFLRLARALVADCLSAELVVL